MTSEPPSEQPSGPPRLIRRWEALGRETQVKLAFPTLFLVITAIHFILPGHRPWWWNPVYGFGYAFVLTGVVIAVTEGEQRRRAERQAEAGEADQRSAVDR